MIFLEDKDKCANLGECVGLANGLLPVPLFMCLRPGSDWCGKTTDGIIFCRIDGNPEKQKSCNGFKKNEMKNE